MKTPRKWNKEEEDYVRKNYPDGDLEEMAARFDCRVDQVRSLAKRLKVHRSPVWSEERDARLRELFPEHTNAEIAEILGSTESAIMARGFLLKLRKTPEFMYRHSMKGMFKKGHKTFNKGKKQTEYMSAEAIERTKATRFKKGLIPHNAKPVGSERIDSDGYVMIKPPRGIFRAKHVVIWEEVHGKIPKGYAVVFKDGDKRNVTLDNLEMVSRQELLKRNSVHRYPEDIKRSLYLIGALKHRITTIEKKNGKLRDCK